MPKALVWLALVYAALKLASVVPARNPGFRRTTISLRDRLRAREPTLMLVAVATTVPLAFFTDWYAHRHFANMLASASTCYGQIMALQEEPELTRGVTGYAVYERMGEYRTTSLDAASHLGMSAREAELALAAKVAIFTQSHAALADRRAAGAMHEQIVAGRRCLLPPPPPPNA